MKKALRKEMFENNARECGMFLGKSIRGKGTEVFTLPETALEASVEWMSAEEFRNSLKKFMDTHNIEDYYIDYLFFRDPDDWLTHKYESPAAGVSAYSLKNVLKKQFRRGHYIESIRIASRPKLLGYISLSKYDDDFYGQIRFVADLGSLEGITRAKLEDELFGPSEKHDFGVVHNDNALVDEWLPNETVNGRMYEVYNDYALEEFWNYIDNHSAAFDEIDSDEKVIVYHYKGKDWYVAPAVYIEDLTISYLEKDNNKYYLETEYVEFETYTVDHEIMQKCKDYLLNIKKELEIKSYIYNGLELCMNCDVDVDEKFNVNIIRQEFDSLWDAAYEILDYVNWESDRNPKDEAMVAYEKFIEFNLKNDVLFGKYKHLKMLKEIALANNGEVIIDYEYEDTLGLKVYAIIYKDEKYHFYLRELYNSYPKKFFKEATEKLNKRIKEKLEKRYLYRKAQKVFVGIEDSIKAGNCRAGTESFIKKHQIDPQKIGGIRGDVLLSMAEDKERKLVERAVLEALKKIENKGE